MTIVRMGWVGLVPGTGDLGDLGDMALKECGDLEDLEGTWALEQEDWALGGDWGRGPGDPGHLIQLL